MHFYMILLHFTVGVVATDIFKASKNRFFQSLLDAGDQT